MWRLGLHNGPPRIFFAALFWFAGFLLAGPAIHAQTDPQQQPLQVTTEIVKLDAAIIDERGEFVSGLQPQNFKILDAGAAQPIVFFAPTDAPAQILVLIETSPAVYLIQSDHIAALNALSAGLAPGDEIALVAYNEAPRTILPFTADKDALTDSLKQVQYTIGFGELNLFDSISAVLDSMAAIPGKKAIVLLTTGLDSSPASRWDALRQKLKLSDVVIFPVALGAPLRSPAKNKSKGVTHSGEPHVFAEADKVLRSLAEITGGRAFFPESEKDFVPAYAQIAATLRHQYLLGIAPVHDGKFHPLTVQLLDSSGAPYVSSNAKNSRKIFTRQGYLAPAP